MTVDRYQGFEFDPSALAEEVDLELERRKQILYADARLATSTHWDVLGLPWNAPGPAARNAYLEQVKVFHPDRYAGKRLGTFRARLERVFRRLTDARDVLSDETKRAAYARTTAPAEEFARLEARRLEDERRAVERRQRIARQNPLLARAARNAELVARGKALLAEGKAALAANDLVLASGLDPNNAELAALAAEAKRRAGAVRANAAYEEGLGQELLGSFSSALAAFRQALEADARHVRAAAHGARCALALGDGAGARELAEQAVRAGPSVGAAHEALGLVLDAMGARKDARRELERALELDPKLDVAKDRLKKLRWSFLG